ncbi:restriction endonuclease subunit S [Nostoc sp. 'Lobaria pulmonaria (5183) cyanobiont']|uniref:restriction endonuclease subunit S n=1 Tax=Nostoc sp. 'Lobaria pulmonaria (5183) cyanobiont' TaxID=1618022 RepID=UPI000CF31A17|nr:restriction endonuclease subunit S [Nostoc sp. 'Lobaria pulmonaria (5183) cyanobiont']AVH74482.1 type I restriction-modification protein subunit S [Nostoc sp. 'Lobaria pulmonaria (5183) cyanobiont']
MREHWIDSTIGDLCEVIAGQSPAGEYYNQEGIGLPFYQGKKEFGQKFIGKPQTWTRKTTKEAELGDILMSVRAPVGPINFATEKICIGRGLAAIKAGTKIDRYFLFYGLLFKQDEIRGNEGAVFASINKNQIESIKFFYPPLPEQKQIVAILDEAFEGIDRAIANAEKNLANARELFESYLNAIFTQKGDGWEWVSLSEITTDITDGDHQPPPKSQSGIPFITISNIDKQNRKVDFSNTFKVSPEYFEKLKSNRKPRKGDLLYTVTGSYGIPVLVDHDMNFCFQRHIGLIRPNDETNSKCLYYIFLSRYLLNQADECATGTAQKTVSLSGLRRFSVPKIPKEKQEIIVAELDIISEKVSSLETIYRQKIAALNELKQSILQKAFTGELTADTANQTTKAAKEGIAA